MYSLQATIGDIFLRISFIRQLVAQRSWNLVGFIWNIGLHNKQPNSAKHYCAGHGKIETMGALAISSLLLVTGGGIAWHAIETIQACLHTIMMCSGLA